MLPPGCEMLNVKAMLPRSLQSLKIAVLYYCYLPAFTEILDTHEQAAVCVVSTILFLLFTHTSVWSV